MRIALIVLLLFLASCDPVKRHAKLVERYPYVHVDEIDIRIDTHRVIVDRVETDTILNVNNIYDTIYLNKDRVRVKTVRINDSIYINAECVEDTIYIYTENKTITKHSQQPAKNYSIWLIAGVLLVGSVLLIRQVLK